MLRRLGLFLGVLAVCCLATGAIASAAPTSTSAAPNTGSTAPSTAASSSTTAAASSSLSLDISSIDLSKYPQVSVALQLGGASALGLGDLSKEAAYVKVDGSVVPVDSLKTAGEGVALPVQTVLLIDQSGSMKGAAIAAASAAAAGYIGTMRAGDTAAIQAFNNEFLTLQDFTGDQAALKASLSGLNPQRDTGLYDALMKSVATFDQDHTSAAQYIILLSDGGDTASVTTLDAALAAVRASRITIYTIGLKTQEFDSQPLQSIAEASGGSYLETPDPASLTSIYQNLAKEFHTQYVLTFTVPASSTSSGAGNLSIQLTAAGKAAVAQRGFFYPAAHTSTTLGSQTTTTALPAVVSGQGPMGRFLRWGGSGWIIGVVVFLLVVMTLYLVLGALMPRRDVLAEYGGLLDRTSVLGPQPLEEEKAKTTAVGRAASKVLAVRGYQDPLQRLIDDAALKFRASEFAVLQLISLVIVIVIAKLAGLPLFALIILALVFIIVPLLWLDSKGDARRKAFNEQVPNTLMLLAGSLKAGQALEQALNVAAMESPQPTGPEFNRVLAQLRLGVVPEEALGGLAERMRSEAFGWAVMSTVIQRQVGGNLAEIYESTASTLRERAKLRREIETLTAEGRISAIILVILPFAVGGMVAVINRGYLAPLLSTTMGNIMLAVSFVLMIVGILWMRAIVRVDK